MTNDQVSTTSTTPAPWAARGAPRPDPKALLQGLEQLREALRKRIDAIEAIALVRGDAPPADPSEREKALRKRIADLEQRQAILIAEAKRREQECQAAMEKIEDDRRLLADAWARLEQEQVEGAVAAHPHPRPAAAAPAPSAAVPAFRSAVAIEADDVVAHAILKQFQSLRSDVRRTANGSRAPR